MSAPRRGWRYFATRLNGDGTETVIDLDLPIEGVEIEDVLSGDNAISGTLSPVFQRLKDPTTGEPLLREWANGIYAECDGEIRQGGILTHSGFVDQEWGIEASGFTNYGRDMPWTAGDPVANDPPGWNIPSGKDGSGLGINVDPLAMVRVIWDHIQSKHDGNIGLEVSPQSSPVRIGTPLENVTFTTSSGETVSFEAGPFKLNWYNSHNLMGIVDSLAKETPFDYHERHYWKSDGTIGHYLEIGYPKIGRKRNDLRFVYGENIFDPPSIERDGSLYASGALVLGQGDGPAMINGLYEVPTNGRLRRIAVVVDDGIRSKKAAMSRGKAEAQWRQRLDDVTQVVVHDHPNARLGEASVGDEILVEAPSEGSWVGLSMWVRILSIAYQPETGKVAAYTIARTDKLTDS